jgi:hypothetical protein
MRSVAGTKTEVEPRTLAKAVKDNQDHYLRLEAVALLGCNDAWNGIHLYIDYIIIIMASILPCEANLRKIMHQTRLRDAAIFRVLLVARNAHHDITASR